MGELIYNVIGWWAFVGFIFIAATPTPRTKRGAKVVIFLGGPFSWIYTLIRYIDAEPWKKSI